MRCIVARCGARFAWRDFCRWRRCARCRGSRVVSGKRSAPAGHAAVAFRPRRSWRWTQQASMRDGSRCSRRRPCCRSDGAGRLDDDSRYGSAWIEALRVAQADARQPHPRRARSAPRLSFMRTIPTFSRNSRDTARHRDGTQAVRHHDDGTLGRCRTVAVASGRDYALRVFDNRGRDVLPFLSFDDCAARGST